MGRTYLSIRFLLCSVFVLFAFPSSSPSAEQAPPPRSIYSCFDLQYLPEVMNQGLVAFRPVEIARYAREQELEVATQVFTMFFSQVFHDAHIGAAEPPGFASIEQCVFNLSMQISTPKPDKKGHFAVGGTTPCVLRTVKPFDWDNLVRNWFPKAVQRKVAGRTYLRMRIDSPAESDEVPWTGGMCFFCPDDRTLVVGDEEQMFELLDRLAANQPAPTPPPGWKEVDRDFAAFVLDLREQKLVNGKFPPEYPWGKDLLKLLDSCQTIAFGFSLDERTNLHVVGTTKNPTSTLAAKKSLQKLIKAARNALTVEGEEGPLKSLVMEILTDLVIETSDAHFNLTASADRNILELLIALGRKPD